MQVDIDEAVLEQAGAALQDEEKTGKAKSKPGSEGPDEQGNFLGTFKDKESAEKGFEDLKAEISRFQSERDKAMAKLQKLESKLEEVVEKRQTGQATAAQEEEARRRLKEFAESWDEEGTGQQLVDFVVGAMQSAQQSAVMQLQSAYDGKIKELETKLAELSEMLETTSLDEEIQKLYQKVRKEHPDWPTQVAREFAKALVESGKNTSGGADDADQGEEITPEMMKSSTSVASKSGGEQKPDKLGTIAAAIASGMMGAKLSKNRLDQLNKKKWSK